MQAEHPSGGHAAAFAPGLTDPSIAPPEDVVAAPGKGVVKRYNVYRNNVTVSLIDALAAVYPAIQRITGADFLRAMARFHLRATPPTSPLLFEYGRDFPAFIESYKYARDALACGYRAHRARVAGCLSRSRPACARCRGVSRDRTGVSLAEVRFTPHPAARVVRSRYPAVAIFAMNRNDGPVTPFRSSEAEDALVTRPEHEVLVSRLPAGGAAFLTHLLEGASLGEAVAAAFHEAPSFDIQANLAGMLSAGVFSSIQHGD